jgi:hypothetical protein
MFKMIFRIIKIFLIQSERYRIQRQKSQPRTEQDNFRPAPSSIFEYKDRTLVKGRKYIGPLFEEKPKTHHQNHDHSTVKGSHKNIEKQSPLRVLVKSDNKPERAVFARSSGNTALDYSQMEEENRIPVEFHQPNYKKRHKGSNSTVVVFLVLLVAASNAFPAAFRGIKFFFFTFIIFIISLFITSKLKK